MRSKPLKSLYLILSLSKDEAQIRPFRQTARLSKRHWRRQRIVIPAKRSASRDDKKMSVWICYVPG